MDEVLGLSILGVNWALAHKRWGWGWGGGWSSPQAPGSQAVWGQPCSRSGAARWGVRKPRSQPWASCAVLSIPLPGPQPALLRNGRDHKEVHGPLHL